MPAKVTPLSPILTISHLFAKEFMVDKELCCFVYAMGKIGLIYMFVLAIAVCTQ